MRADAHLQWTTFVLSRRIAAAMVSVEHALGEADALHPGQAIALGDAGTLSLEQPFELQWLPRWPAWRTCARLRTPTGRHVARVELELAAWSSDASELLLRPIAGHPERWGKRRLRRYFALAHPSTDYVAVALSQAAAAARDRDNRVALATGGGIRQA